MATLESKYKGAAFNSTVDVLRELVGESTWPSFVATLPEETKKAVTHRPPASEWVPLAWGRDLVEAAATGPFAADPSLLQELGRRSVLKDLKGVYKVLVRILNPEHVLSRVAQAWDQYYQNNGGLRLERLGDKQVRLYLTRFAYPSPAYFRVVAGAMQAFGQATGAKSVTVDVRPGEVSRSAIYDVRWT